MKTFTTTSSKQTQKMGQLLAEEIRGGQIICLSGDLGAGKTTFTQGFLKGLGVKGPYTSPTFVVLKEYKRTTNNKQQTTKNKKELSVIGGKSSVYHVDAYRVGAKDMLNLGWEEIIADNPPAGGNIIIIEWADRIKKIIPKKALWIELEWLEKDKRRIKLAN